MPTMEYGYRKGDVITWPDRENELINFTSPNGSSGYLLAAPVSGGDKPEVKLLLKAARLGGVELMSRTVSDAEVVTGPPVPGGVGSVVRMSITGKQLLLARTSDAEMPWRVLNNPSGRAWFSNEEIVDFDVLLDAEVSA
jgi:hypothetical protein